MYNIVLFLYESLCAIIILRMQQCEKTRLILNNPYHYNTEVYTFNFGS